MADLINRQQALDCFSDWIDRCGHEHTADEDATYQRIAELPGVQPDHVADVSKKVDMTHEYIYKIVQDCDGVSCYIKQGKIIRCKDCKHKHVENMVWTCPFGLPGGENFFCGYGTEPYKGE